MPHYRIAIGSCSHPSLPQPLWPIIASRNPASFVWAGDAIYADVFKGLDWKSVGLRRDKDTKKWRFTFPPPAIHQDATPEIIRGWYEKQWEEQIGYRQFVEGNHTVIVQDWHQVNNLDGCELELRNHTLQRRPFVFGTIDDHDYGANNGDVTYRFRRESNLEFMDFLYSGVPNDCDTGFCPSSMNDIPKDRRSCDGHASNFHDAQRSARKVGSSTRGRKKDDDPMYQRALQGKGVYGVQLFDFSRDTNKTSMHKDGLLWGNGYWVPEHDAKIDPDVKADESNKSELSYSTTHSVAIFVLDVRSNKTPWPKKNRHSSASTEHETLETNYDFLGTNQWKWFEEALSNSKATINIIVSGLQIHPNRFPNDGNIVEEWSKFPSSQQKLYDTVLDSDAKNPLFVSGDVHMSQILRKDCIRRSDMKLIQHGENTLSLLSRPLIEVTTSGLTHSWGTSFSSQPKHHTWPLKPYSYFVSRTFMTIAHHVMPWRDLLIHPAEDAEYAKKEGRNSGKVGKQFDLGLNFGEFEFSFQDKGNNQMPQDGSVTLRIFGTGQSPKLEMRWTFDELSGKVAMPGMTASPEDFTTLEQYYALHNNELSSSIRKSDPWICVPYRGIPTTATIYATNSLMFLVFCTLFFTPHALVVLFVFGLRRWLVWKKFKRD